MNDNTKEFATITFEKNEFIMLYHALDYMESSSSLNDSIKQDSNNEFQNLFYQLFDKIQREAKDITRTSIYDI